MYRAGDYDRRVAEHMKDPEYAQEFLLSLIDGDERLNLEEALKHTIRRMGISEFAEKANVSRENVHAFLSGKRKLKPETMDQYLKPFGLKTRLVVEKAS